MILRIMHAYIGTLSIWGLFLGLLLAGSLRAGTLRVPQEYPSIAEAVEAALTGDEVLVSPGKYLLAAPLVIEKGISVRSEAGPASTPLTLAAVPEPSRAKGVIVSGAAAAFILRKGL